MPKLPLIVTITADALLLIGLGLPFGMYSLSRVYKYDLTQDWIILAVTGVMSFSLIVLWLGVFAIAYIIRTCGMKETSKKRMWRAAS